MAQSFAIVKTERSRPTGRFGAEGIVEGQPGQVLRVRFLIRHAGPPSDPWLGVALGLHKHRELGKWPIAGKLASELGLTIEEDKDWTDYWTAPIEIPINVGMEGKTFDALKIVARSAVADDLGNLDSVRYDDDWDDNVLTIRDSGMGFTIIGDAYGVDDEMAEFVET